MFPVIKHINDLLPFIEGNPQFRVQEQPNGTTVVCYMLQDEDTFRGEHDAFYKECRGITFRADGTVASRTLHKFQNVGENDQTQPDQIPWNRIARIMDKRDGSMITFLEINGQIMGKTKKTFTSNEAKAATEFLHEDLRKVEWVRDCLRQGFTPTFEWTSPRFPIVLTYEKDELTLLQLRHNESGMYPMFTMTNPNFASEVPFPIVENLRDQFKDARDLLELAKTAEGIEGWIIQDDNGQMWKIKTKWYCDLHHAVTFTRWRDVARLVAEDKADDLKAAFAMTGRSIEPILTVERHMAQKIELTRALVEEYVGLGKGFERSAKDMAMMHKEHEHFGLIMRAFRGSEINWSEWYMKNHVDSWSLEVIPVALPE